MLITSHWGAILSTACQFGIKPIQRYRIIKKGAIKESESLFVGLRLDIRDILLSKVVLFNNYKKGCLSLNYEGKFLCYWHSFKFYFTL